MPRSPSQLESLMSGPRWSRDDAREILAALEASGLTVAQFAADHGVQAQRLYLWKRQLAQTSSTSLVRAPATSFIEVARSQSVPALSPARYELVLAGGGALRIRGAADIPTVRALLALLREAHAC